MRRGRFPSGLTSGSAGPSAHCLPLLDSSPTQMGSLHTPVSTCRPWLWLGSVSPLTSAARSRSQNEKTKTKQPGTLLHSFLIASGGRHPGTGVGTPAEDRLLSDTAHVLWWWPCLGLFTRAAGAALRAGKGPQGAHQGTGASTNLFSPYVDATPKNVSLPQSSFSVTRFG